MSPRAPGLRLPRSWLALLVATGLASGLAGGAAVAWLEAGPETATVAGSAPVPTDAVPLNRLTVAPLVARVAPAVVNVAVLQASPYAQNPLLRDPYYRFFLGVPDEALAPRIEAFAVGQLVVALPRFGVGDGRGEKLSHDGIVPVHQGPPIPSRIPTLFPIGAGTARI